MILRAKSVGQSFMRKAYAYPIECVNTSICSQVARWVSFAASYPATGEMGDEGFNSHRACFGLCHSKGAMVDIKSMAKASRARRTNDRRGLLGLPQRLSEENKY